MTEPALPPAEAPVIATVEAASDPVSPRTGEPRRPWSVALAAVAVYLGAAVVVAGVLTTWWFSVDAWVEAAPLHPLIGDLFGELTRGQLAWLRAGLAVAELAIAALVGAAALITGVYAWRGHRWSRWAGLIAAALSAATLVLHEVAWAAIPLIVIGAAALWLPATNRFFAHWHAVRHAEISYPELADAVAYGPLPRYRS